MKHDSMDISISSAISRTVSRRYECLKASSDFIVGSNRINIEKRLLASSFLSVCLHISARLTLVGFSRHFILGASTKICRETPNFCENRTKI
jgi:hypothetical protein